MLGSRYGWAQDKDQKLDVLLDKTFKKAALQYPWVAEYSDRYNHNAHNNNNISQQLQHNHNFIGV